MRCDPRVAVQSQEEAHTASVGIPCVTPRCVLGKAGVIMVSPRKGVMKRKWVRAAVGGVLVAITMTAGLFVAGRVSAWVLGVDPFFEWARPTMADVLDGRVANGERLAAISQVSDLSRELRTDSASSIGETVWTSCEQGQNNYKVHDGFRLSCAASAASYLAWSGEYEDMAIAVRDRIAGKCPTLELDPGPQSPIGGAPTTVAIYRCSDQARVWVTFASAQRSIVPISDFLVGETTEQSRRISGPSSDELLRSLSEYQWLAWITVGQTYYEDRP